MNKIAFLFPGQGSQAVGMGLSVADHYPEAQSFYRKAEEILDWQKSGKGLIDILKMGPEEILRETEFAQPALYVTGYCAYVALRSQNIHPEAAAGHSIGEYVALAAAGVFDFDRGLQLVKKRGELMKKAARDNPGAMAAIVGLSAEQVQDCCDQAQSEGLCIPVNFNSPEQVVIAGEKKSVNQACAAATEKGAKRAILLNISGAFHSPLMKEAAEAMRQVLQAVSFQDAAIPVAMNVDGQLRTRAEDIKEALCLQLNSPVQWVRSLETLKNKGFNSYIECGAGRVLSGLVKKFDRQLSTYSTDTLEAIQNIVTSLMTKAQG